MHMQKRFFYSLADYAWLDLVRNWDKQRNDIFATIVAVSLTLDVIL